MTRDCSAFDPARVTLHERPDLRVKFGLTFRHDLLNQEFDENLEFFDPNFFQAGPERIGGILERKFCHRTNEDCQAFAQEINEFRINELAREADPSRLGDARTPGFGDARAFAFACDRLEVRADFFGLGWWQQPLVHAHRV